MKGKSKERILKKVGSSSNICVNTEAFWTAGAMNYGVEVPLIFIGGHGLPLKGGTGRFATSPSASAAGRCARPTGRQLKGGHGNIGRKQRAALCLGSLTAQLHQLLSKTHTHARTHTHAHTHTHTKTQTHAHTHTHTYSLPSHTHSHFHRPWLELLLEGLKKKTLGWIWNLYLGHVPTIHGFRTGRGRCM